MRDLRRGTCDVECCQDACLCPGSPQHAHCCDQAFRSAFANKHRFRYFLPIPGGERKHNGELCTRAEPCVLRGYAFVSVAAAFLRTAEYACSYAKRVVVGFFFCALVIKPVERPVPRALFARGRYARERSETTRKPSRHYTGVSVMMMKC